MSSEDISENDLLPTAIEPNEPDDPRDGLLEIGPSVYRIDRRYQAGRWTAEISGPLPESASACLLLGKVVAQSESELDARVGRWARAQQARLTLSRLG